MKKRILATIMVSAIVTILTGITACKSNPSDKNNTVSAESNKPPKSKKKSGDSDSKKNQDSNSEVIPNQVPLTVIVDKLRTPTAGIVIGVYASKNKFLNVKDQLKEYHLKPENGKFQVEITDLPYGEYAMAIYQDVNNDNKINKNGIGIPKEPYAFSNNYHPRIHAPSFKDCKFTYNEKTNTVKMTLIGKK